ncbi:hypothetical protein OG455_29345 [Kitasatospora sp. NBC_01287]|uniref:hypothetical protein n=1 Tax=Kitasatospora sp. NBC_01287 TaxID=2903573 RepID=UPI00225115D8|nr:hypothetical protein [Kitasatospora sp. NBC_01287]MCX4749569.1 hypothetical protein [Kitasatospora sp. NBC_01287]
MHEHENNTAGDDEERPQESEQRPAPRPGSQAEQDAIFAALVAQFDDPVDLNRPDWPEIENLRARTTIAPSVTPAAPGPRDWDAAEDPDEGHYIPPEPPPLPTGDTTAKFAWIAVLGGPALLLFDALVWGEVSGWPAWVGLTAFLGGFTTLVARMKDRDPDEPHDPHGGAVV